MCAYLIRRLLLTIPTIFLVTVIVFFLVRLIPGDVIKMMVAEISEQATNFDVEETERNIREALGLDVPVYVQYVRWLSKAAIGDLGKTLWTETPVTEVIFARLPVSIELGILAMLTSVIIALPIGVVSAIRQDTGIDYLGRSFAILLISLPSFWIGTMVVVYPAIWWRWAPPLEYVSFLKGPAENLLQFIIPAIILGMVLSGVTMRMTRTMMLEVLRQDYIRTAWAKGLTERVIIYRHALKNAMIPVITVIGTQVTILIGGAVITETIFALPGIGRLLVEAINKRDYPIISGINLVLATFVLALNLVVDLAYAYLDPRVSF